MSSIWGVVRNIVVVIIVVGVVVMSVIVFVMMNWSIVMMSWFCYYRNGVRLVVSGSDVRFNVVLLSILMLGGVGSFVV